MSAPLGTFSLDEIVLTVSEDSAKVDLEVVCQVCGDSLCDAEAGDSLAVLLSVARDHARSAHNKVEVTR